MNNEKKQAPRCPYCGAMMLKQSGDLYTQPDDADDYFMWLHHWYMCSNKECGCESPARRTEEEAYKAAMARYEEPNRVLTLEELQAYTGYAWYEGDHKWYHSSFDYPVWIEDGKYNYEGDLYDIPDEVTGRFWMRKPTPEEMANTPWEEKQK